MNRLLEPMTKVSKVYFGFSRASRSIARSAGAGRTAWSTTLGRAGRGRVVGHGVVAGDPAVGARRARRVASVAGVARRGLHGDRDPDVAAELLAQHATRSAGAAGSRGSPWRSRSGAASRAVSSTRPSGRVSPIQAFCCGRMDGSSKRGRARFQTATSSALSSTGRLTPVVACRCADVEAPGAAGAGARGAASRPSHEPVGSPKSTDLSTDCVREDARTVPGVAARPSRRAPVGDTVREPNSARRGATIGTGVSPSDVASRRRPLRSAGSRGGLV